MVFTDFNCVLRRVLNILKGMPLCELITFETSPLIACNFRSDLIICVILVEELKLVHLPVHLDLKLGYKGLVIR